MSQWPFTPIVRVQQACPVRQNLNIEAKFWIRQHLGERREGGGGGGVGSSLENLINFHIAQSLSIQQRCGAALCLLCPVKLTHCLSCFVGLFPAWVWTPSPRAAFLRTAEWCWNICQTSLNCHFESWTCLWCPITPSLPTIWNFQSRCWDQTSQHSREGRAADHPHMVTHLKVQLVHINWARRPCNGHLGCSSNIPVEVSVSSHLQGIAVALAYITDEEIALDFSELEPQGLQHLLRTMIQCWNVALILRRGHQSSSACYTEAFISWIWSFAPQLLPRFQAL